MKELPVRKPNRLKDYDYSENGYYFITFCIKERYELLLISASVGARIARPLSDAGIIVKKAIENVPLIYPNVEIDKYVIMPNHVHLIVAIQDERGRELNNGRFLIQ